MPPPLTAPILCPVLIGRSSQLETLARLITLAQAGTGQTVLIAGEAGVGKSRLAAEVGTQAAAAGFGLLKGNCFESDRSLPYAPLLDLLRAFCTDHTDGELASALGSQAAEIVKLIPELTDRLPGLAPSPRLEPEAEKHRLFSVLTQFLTDRGPLLIVVEDLHWSDDTSLEFLLRLARRILSLPILLLLTYRTDEPNRALEHFLGDLDRERLALELKLARLNEGEMGEMLRAIFALAHPLSASFQQNLYQLTEGNPFFIEETLKALSATGELFLEHGSWDHQSVSELQIPRSVQDTVRRRSERLSDKARHVLELAAVAGRRFDFDLLQLLTGMEEQELLSLIQELVAAQLVVEVSADQFAFRHALTREAVYHSLLQRQRRKYHGQIAEAMERLYAPALEARTGSLAYHTFAAGNWDKALAYSQQEGERALAIYAPQSAIDLFTRAL